MAQKVPIIILNHQVGWMNLLIILEECKDYLVQSYLFLDGFYRHLIIEIIDFSIENNIHILVIEPHTSHAWQLSDVSVYGPNKSLCAQ